MEIQVNNDYIRNRLDIYLYQRGPTGNRRFFVPLISDDPTIKTYSYKWVEIDDMTYACEETGILPVISMPAHYGMFLIEGIAEYAKNQGISVKEQSNMAGKLLAIEKHNEFLSGNLQKLIDYAISNPVNSTQLSTEFNPSK